VADEISKAYDAEVTLVPGSGGVFDVIADGKLVYSKAKTGRFPEPGEVVGNIKE
jgi:selT/selW/selH-like putative selenoprotein